ncbi:hypothetical protein ABES35_02850 [Bacillus subtilis]|uniref:hypothetical protein n=1 Tax=Bacillus subtilis TaxID=1423 RepID=UPI002550DD01|nr:hypothetical protein [Bacillus subtilis]MDK7658276.1 hypothetical protein [Bacillus subtilis]MEC2401673.1 hypothetical protein [Bacillus subtilis]MED4660165.1 hypothetical protein [Bacillus subtilis]MED4664470.1 hypothetical protein [Bacillus subtilis]WEZ27437.1 hypothetical protein P5635_15170 [Bacillus subtilis]
MKRIKKDMDKYSKIKPLEYMMKRGKIPLLEYYKKSNLNYEYGLFLGIDIVIPLHKVLDLPAQDLENSWQNTQNYINSALEILQEEYNEDIEDINSTIDVDGEQIREIKYQLGDPPVHCYPIYIITTGKGKNEKVVYIGKTSSKNHRFAGGHLAALKLNDPKYDGLEKNIYFGCLNFLDSEKESVPLEWIRPYDHAKELLTSVEACLIYHFKPELNSEHIENNHSKIPVSLIIENWSGQSDILHSAQVAY